MRKLNSNQTGVTLLLAVLVLSSLILVSLSVATFTIQELRASRASRVSEPALNAAESGAEQALWGFKRTGNTAVPNCLSSSVSNNLSGSNATVSYCKDYTGNNYDVGNTAATVFFLYDPDDFNGDTDLLGYPYSTLTLTNNSNSVSVNVTVTRLDGAPVASITLNHNQSQAINIPAVSAGTEGRVQISMVTVSGTASVYANTDRGLPDNFSLVATGCSSRSNVVSCSASGQELFARKIQVSIHSTGTIVPPPAPAPLPPPPLSVTVLIVGGGGSAGLKHTICAAGAGGGGGVLIRNPPVTIGNSYPMVVGAGGVAVNDYSQSWGRNGGNSGAFGFVAFGGGGGGGATEAGPGLLPQDGSPGGSGGGGACGRSGGSGTAGQGFAGTAGSSGGGGGGAGGTALSGNGGPGVVFAGNSYGGGGGVGAGLGGSGVGGNGHEIGGMNGVPNSGGGGGGYGDTYGDFALGGNGGSGLIIVRYPSSEPTGTGGTITYTDSNGLNPRASPPYASGYTVHTFTAPGGTFTR